MIIKDLNALNDREPFVRIDGTLAPYGHRWLNRLKQLFRAPLVYDVAWTPSAVSAGVTEEQTLTVSGVAVGETVIAFVPPSAPTYGISHVNVRVTDTDEVTVAWQNTTAGGLSPPSGTYRLAVLAA